jgi:Leucine-rich repeat (LRR) protein
VHHLVQRRPGKDDDVEWRVPTLSRTAAGLHELHMAVGADRYRYRNRHELLRIEAVGSFVHLHTLSIHGSLVSDLSCLVSCFQLRNLSLVSSHVSSLKQLGSFIPQLQDLSLRQSTVSTVAPLGLAHLRKLSIQECGFKDLVLLQGCDQLQDLTMSSSSALSDLEGLRGCSQLQRLEMAYCQEVISIAPLAACGELEHLEMIKCRNVRDLAPLSSCRELKHLNIECAYVSSLAPLSACRELEHLNIDLAQVSSLASLSACGKLKRLCMKNCRLVSSVASLSACFELKDLDLSGTHVQNIMSLSSCSKLVTRNDQLRRDRPGAALCVRPASVTQDVRFREQSCAAFFVQQA